MRARIFENGLVEIYEVNQFGDPCRIRTYRLPEGFEIPTLNIKGLGINKRFGNHPVADLYITQRLVRSLVTLGVAPREHFYWKGTTPIAVRSE